MRYLDIYQIYGYIGKAASEDAKKHRSFYGVFFNATCIFDKSFGLRRSGHKEVKKPVIDQVISVYGKNEIRKMFSDAVKHGGLLFADKNRVQKLKSLFLTVQFDEKALFNSELIDQSIQHFTGIINSKSILNEYNKTSKNRQITKDVMSQAYFKTERNRFDFRTDFKRNRLHLLQKKVECRAYRNLHLLDKEQYKKSGCGDL